MKYFIDTEFIEDGKTIDLISIGIACEDGREFYAVNEDCEFSKASDWVIENVLVPIGITLEGGQAVYFSDIASDARFYGMTKESIRDCILLFIGDTTPEFWADYASYDWVVFCQLFGTMMDLPKGFPMYCNDIQQECNRLGNLKLPKQSSGQHNALEDARWVKKAHKFLQKVR